MANRMTVGRRTGAGFQLVAVLALAPGMALAQALSDPMQPPALFAAPIGASGPDVSAGPGLQSTLVSQGRRIAIIDGKPMKVGDIIGGARIVAIDSSSVTLREGKATRVLEMNPGLKTTTAGEKAAKARSPRKGSAEGT